mmetsp:Transcript_3885/g.9901  ORF Transcript_3885/g.9901 Transcript_3885/m.9901 type:complete len:228 (-) Transcript_3885:90-773(-)
MLDVDLLKFPARYAAVGSKKWSRSRRRDSSPVRARRAGEVASVALARDEECAGVWNAVIDAQQGLHLGDVLREPAFLLQWRVEPLPLQPGQQERCDAPPARQRIILLLSVPGVPAIAPGQPAFRVRLLLPDRLGLLLLLLQQLPDLLAALRQDRAKDRTMGLRLRLRRRVPCREQQGRQVAVRSRTPMRHRTLRLGALALTPVLGELLGQTGPFHAPLTRVPVGSKT